MEITNVTNYSKLIKLNIFLVRHAETEYNKLGIIQGQLDTKLSSKGIQQAKCLGNHLKNVNFKYIFSSDLERALKTADEVFALNVNKHNLKKVINEKLLRERKFGEAEGKHKEFLLEQAKKLDILVQNYVPNGAETNEEVVLRWKIFLDRLCKQLILEHLMTDLNSSNRTNKHNGIISYDLNELLNDFKPFLFDMNHNSNHENKESQNDILIMTHGALMKRIVKYLITETNCVYDECHLEYIDKSVPNTSITNFEIEIDIEDSSLMNKFLKSVKNSSSKDDIISHLKIKCNYINDSSHICSDNY